MNDSTGWSKALTVTADGDTVISHAGAAALRLTADRTGLTTALSRALHREDFAVHDPSGSRSTTSISTPASPSTCLNVPGRCRLLYVTAGSHSTHAIGYQIQPAAESPGYLLTHYAISALICRAATEADIDPDRSSSCAPCASSAAGSLIQRPFPPDRLQHLLAMVSREITTPRHLHRARRHRSYPRVVKRARHNSYRVKQPHDVGTRYAGPPTIHLVNLDPRHRLIS